MSTKAPVKTQAKTPAAPAAARMPQPPVPEPEHVAERPDIATQLEGASRLGHSLGAISVRNAAPSQIQALPLIQRQEIPDEEEEELQLKRQPAAVQRQDIPEEEEEELMMKPEEQRVGPQGGPIIPEVEAGIRRARGGGQPLEEAVQAQMSEALGHDFGAVRVHTDSEADELNQQLQAKAFTTGPDIFFRWGEYNPSSSGSRELIAHELSHVVQQSSGIVNGDGSGMTVRPAGDAFEQEADRVAEAVIRSINTSVQRQRPDEEEPQMQEEEEEIQTHMSESQSVTVSEDLETRINRARGSRQPLADTSHKPMEQAVKADFRDIRVHTGPEPDDLNQLHLAKPFTTGPDIFFQCGAYPQSACGGREVRLAKPTQGQAHTRERRRWMGAADETLYHRERARKQEGEEEGYSPDEAEKKGEGRVKEGSFSIAKSREERQDRRRKHGRTRHAQVLQRWKCMKCNRPGALQSMVCNVGGHERQLQGIDGVAGNIKVDEGEDQGFKRYIRSILDYISANKAGGPLVDLIQEGKLPTVLVPLRKFERVGAGKGKPLVQPPHTEYIRQGKYGQSGDIVGQAIGIPYDAFGASIMKEGDTRKIKGIVTAMGLLKPEDIEKATPWAVVLQHELVHAFLGQRQLDNKLEWLQKQESGLMRTFLYADPTTIEESIVTGICRHVRLSFSENGYRESEGMVLRARYSDAGLEIPRDKQGMTLPDSVGADDQLMTVLMGELGMPLLVARLLIKKTGVKQFATAWREIKPYVKEAER